MGLPAAASQEAVLSKYACLHVHHFIHFLNVHLLAFLAKYCKRGKGCPQFAFLLLQNLFTYSLVPDKLLQRGLPFSHSRFHFVMGRTIFHC